MRHRRRFRRLTRHPVPFWIATVALAAVTASSIAHVAGAAADERARWGVRRAVLVARHDLAPGDALRDVEVRMVPAALVPRGAARDASDRTVVAWIGAGEIVLARRLAPDGLSATAARLPRGTRGVAVPQGQAPLPVEVGDRVDLVATLDTTSVTVATDAVVVAVNEDAVTVAVDRVDAPRVADAVASATVTLVLSGAR
jgi:hypothetical protein